MQLNELDTPCLVLDELRMQDNIARMQGHLDALGALFRPHVETSKCLDVARRQRDAGARGITVSTLKEAEEFFDGGFDDIFYAVAIAPTKVERALALQARILYDPGAIDQARLVAVITRPGYRVIGPE